MNVRLVGITKPIIEGLETPGDLMVYCARVSNPANQMNVLTGPKLLKYCVSHQHWSVFEQVSANIEIETTRDIGRQILRHKSFHFQEFSQRYADPTVNLDFYLREARLQDIRNRQNSIAVDDIDLQNAWNDIQSEIIENAKNAYRWAIDNGLAKEQARAVLPEGLTMSRMYMAGTIRSWIHYILLRSDEATQKEHRQIAVKCGEILQQYVPELAEIL